MSPKTRFILPALCLALSGLTACSSSDHVSMDERGPEVITPDPRILSIEDWQFGGEKGEVVRTTHYRVFTTERDEVIKKRMAGFLEYALVHYRTALGPLPGPRTKLDTYLMDNRRQWENVTMRLMGPVQSKQLSQIQRGGYASKGIGVFYDLGLYDTLAVASHEGWHQYTQKTFRDPLPVWLEEGIASFMEGHRWDQSEPRFRAWANLERYDQLRKARQENGLLSLEELVEELPQGMLDRTDQSLLNYYAQVWALAHFLNEGAEGRYASSLRQLLQDASNGVMRQTVSDRVGPREARRAITTRTGSAVFRAYFTDDLDAAGREYEAFIERILAQGGRSFVAEGRSPQQRSE